MNVCTELKQTPSLGTPMGTKGAKSTAAGTGALGLASAHGVHGMTGQQEPVVEPREL